MTKKINGIDVSECSYYNKDNEPYCCEIWDNECEAQNCYFKQCKRLEQREKALTEIADDLQKRNHDLTLTNEQLEQKNEELKEKINIYENSVIANHDRAVGKRLMEVLQALEEIREIAELAYYSKGIPEEPLSQHDFILDAINNYEQRRIKILTKINEVLNDRN